MSKKFIKHGTSTIKLSAITGVSWRPEWTRYTSAITRHRGRYVGVGNQSFCASVTIKTGDDTTVESYDNNELAEEAYDGIVAKWEDA